ncbi:maleylpyruvate isomerase family mycothiol-dependent enzyme [Nocardia anaemiae]|uniref:maleylpyruvate isomerase family mycothiol-dependent enzyme n=1 Tax=Nocardia anaemiae TaxID=263910 RepID=UPI0007A3AF9D|nr:maleylpyruvate isomerase family mycothiol-dependent enzyme [Nocardia anaemiae]
MSETEVRVAIEAERGELAEMLAGLEPEAWDEPTLCAGWRVREVVAHITMPFRMSMPRFALEMLKARGNFNKMADKSARSDAAVLTAEELVAAVRDNVNHPWKPPGGGYAGALSHDVIHGLDITVALGLDRVIPAERMRLVLGALSPRSVNFFGVDLDGIELRADDLDFTYGSGSVLAGSAQDLLLVLCGRTLPAGSLRGDAADRFTGPVPPAQ